ncbi:chemotaxis protein CheW [Massilia sp. CF038]|uniref:chemotaxis protein CheW n=1 Tax=Massilia sp. CF038 TaxID=1881045 RepID=UPI000916C14A|nr:chemotaxis protein CheW [Massilia sp. CF038]SHH12810.1 chemotaxis-related protein WspB [Massilia sp. CF038]
MKVLVFHIGKDRYGLPLAALTRVLPAAALKQLPQAPAYVAGVMDLHGMPVPVIDLSTLAGMAPEQIWVDTRIILVDYPLAAGSAPLGLLAEHVAGIETIADASLRDAGIDGAPFLGQVSTGANGMLQLVELAQLIPPAVQELLFRREQAA